jgi:UDP-N-acetylmuramate dehydrogenase
MAALPSPVQRNVPLAPYTTLELGGPAEYFARIDTRDELLSVLRWAAAEALTVTVLGGGSNVIVSDQGLTGLVLKLATRGVALEQGLVTAQAGERWDALVERCVDADLAGIECLSGIPGSVGAGPIQNIGAYGQELAERLSAVEVLDLSTLHTRWLEPAECGFAYRDSRWKRAAVRELVLAVRLALAPGGPSSVRYAELARALAGAEQPPSLATVRQAVLALRRSKAMVLDPHDENRRSVGSFFLNPIVSAAQSDAILERALAARLIAEEAEFPRYLQPSGEVKLSAAWLIERAGTRKGERVGSVGVSSRHSLALVHHGGGSSRELLALAETLQQRVRSVFGVELTREPVPLGF